MVTPCRMQFQHGKGIPMKLLKIDSSARDSSISRQLTSRFVEEWRRRYPAGEVIERDLATTLLPHITDDWQATYQDPTTLAPSQRQYLAVSDSLIEELFAADEILIGSPMHNFTISWELKAWIDQVVRVGKTVVYGAAGPRGLLRGKRVVVITSRGGSYSADSSRSDYDFQESYLRRILGFIGLADVIFIHAENQARRERAEPSRVAALERIAQIVSQPMSAAERRPDERPRAELQLAKQGTEIKNENQEGGKLCNS